jgi:hypothetical protein
MEIKLGCAYIHIVYTLKKYSEQNKIPIRRARECIGRIHRFPRPVNTRIISELIKNKMIKYNGGHGDIEILI